MTCFGGSRPAREKEGNGEASAFHFGPSRGEKGGAKGVRNWLGRVREKEEEGSGPRASTRREGAWRPVRGAAGGGG
jgi:hypothetical protein